jgi:hypothetical protein
MQHPDGPGRALELRVILAESAHRLPATAHEKIIDHTLMRPRERPQFGRQGKGEQEILGRHLLLELTLQPLLALMVLAVWAVAMAAGVWHQLLVLASGAFDLHHGAGLAAALLHGRQCLVVRAGESVPVLRQEIGLEAFDEFSQADHLTCPQAKLKPSIRALMRSMA